MTKCKCCKKEGSIKYDIIGWHQDLADEILIDKESGKCFSCLNKNSKK